MTPARPRAFRYRSLAELEADARRLGADVTFEASLDAVFRPVPVGDRVAGNAFAIHPMEGCDGEAGGAPGELTLRRWQRFGDGGAKIIWGEATAVHPGGRANPRQLYLHTGTLAAFRSLVAATREAHRRRQGRDDDLLIGLQLTHSGRYSHGAPVIAYHHPLLDPRTRGGSSLAPISDDELDRLQDRFVEAALLARDAGFDFVDIKLCHGYLLHELLSARRREGKYGGDLENRMRFPRLVLRRIREEAGKGLLLASRLNVFDGLPYAADPATGVGVPDAAALPCDCAFGVAAADPSQPDLAEPVAVARMLQEEGAVLLNVTIGTPYTNPHIGRPYERPSIGSYVSPEHPLAGVDRHFRLAGEMQRALPDLAVVGTGYSWLQRWLGAAAESNLRRGRMRIAGVGRCAIAYPEFVNDLRERGAMDPRKVCLADSKCSDLMRAKGNEAGQFAAGCVPRDRVYAALYRDAVKEKRS